MCRKFSMFLGEPENLKKQDNLDDLDVVCKILLKLILKEWNYVDFIALA
jgi:hypothetical protein